MLNIFFSNIYIFLFLDGVSGESESLVIWNNGCDFRHAWTEFKPIYISLQRPHGWLSSFGIKVMNISLTNDDVTLVFTQDKYRFARITMDSNSGVHFIYFIDDTLVIYALFCNKYVSELNSFNTKSHFIQKTWQNFSLAA